MPKKKAEKQLETYASVEAIQVLSSRIEAVAGEVSALTDVDAELAKALERIEALEKRSHEVDPNRIIAP